jgi:hypothetical protein
MIFASEDEIPMGIRFEGSEARVYVNRGRIEAGPDSFKKVLRSRGTKGTSLILTEAQRGHH